jgi:DNA-binding NarL/FixJ family response regulator
MSVKIILADDHQTIRLAQRCILEREPDFEIVAEACPCHVSDPTQSVFDGG